jgi:hypothetical protein
MPEASFKSTFTWEKGKTTKKTNEKWLWHDKTAFPWDRIIKSGVSDGQKAVSANDVLTAAERVAESLKLLGISVSRDVAHRAPQESDKDTGKVIMDKITRAVQELMR